MYSAEDIQDRLRERSFRPFRIIASEGLLFEIHHPDLVFVGRHDLMIGHPDPVSPTVYDRVTSRWPLLTWSPWRTPRSPRPRAMGSSDSRGPKRAAPLPCRAAAGCA